MDSTKYLDILATLFGFGGQTDLSAYEEAPSYDTYAQLKESISGKGIEVGEIGEMGDGIWCVFEEGELKLMAYISTRGGFYQAGAYDGETAYGASNIGNYETDNRWIECSRQRICASIAAKAWDNRDNPEEDVND